MIGWMTMTPASQVRAHCACHFLGRLARRGRWLPVSRRRRLTSQDAQMVRAAISRWS